MKPTQSVYWNGRKYKPEDPKPNIWAEMGRTQGKANLRLFLRLLIMLFLSAVSFPKIDKDQDSVCPLL